MPTTRYVRSGDASIAYQVVGQGPFDFIWVPGWISNVEVSWEVPENGRFLTRLARDSGSVSEGPWNWRVSRARGSCSSWTPIEPAAGRQGRAMTRSRRSPRTGRSA